MLSWLNTFRNNSKNKILELEKKLFAQNNILDHISHEVRSSIHGVSNISQFLYENWDKLSEQERKKQIGVLAKNNRRIIKLTDELLDLSKFSTGKMVFYFTPIDLLACIKNIVQQLVELNVFNNKVKIELEDHGIKKAMIKGDKARINQLLNNLFNNAIKYTREGTITATINSINYDNKLYWRFTISDTGVGIPASELESIFEIFTRSSRTNKNFIGTGIGLTICREIVTAHKGYIYAENNYDIGAKLVFMIPAYNQRKPRVLIKPNRKQFNILLVDDEVTCHESANLIFTYEQRFKIISAYSGKEAINLTKIFFNKIDLILLDIVLPDISGYEVYKQIRENENSAHIPIVFQSGLTNNYDELKSLLDEQKTYLIHKPYRNEELMEIITQITNNTI